MPITSDDDIRTLFDTETTAVVGCSATAGKPAHDIPAYVQHHGYRVVPINPFHGEVLDETAYGSLADVDEDVGLVDAFRPSKEAGDIVDTTIGRAADRGDMETVWLQLGIRDNDAATHVGEARLSSVQGKCFKVEHSRPA